MKSAKAHAELEYIKRFLKDSGVKNINVVLENTNRGDFLTVYFTYERINKKIVIEYNNYIENKVGSVIKELSGVITYIRKRNGFILNVKKSRYKKRG